nr:hypothetical protein [Candidatus Dadabacteria bacterium]
MITKLIRKQFNKALQIAAALMLSAVIFANYACVDDGEEFRVVTENPFGVGIIAFSGIPANI